MKNCILWVYFSKRAYYPTIYFYTDTVYQKHIKKSRGIGSPIHSFSLTIFGKKRKFYIENFENK